MAEKLANTPIAEGEILAVMDRVKPDRQLSLLKRSVCPGRSTLSIEEQKIFQCLDCLDEKLQSKLDNKYTATSVDQITLYFVAIDFLDETKNSVIEIFSVVVVVVVY